MLMVNVLRTANLILWMGPLPLGLCATVGSGGR